MGKIALLPEGLETKSEYLDYLGIPDNYMEDYSVLAVVVDRYQKSLKVLHNSGFTVQRLGAGSIISFVGSTGLGSMLQVLKTNRITYDYRDIAEAFYQA